jgi:hypothetical protein
MANKRIRLIMENIMEVSANIPDFPANISGSKAQVSLIFTANHTYF